MRSGLLYVDGERTVLVDQSSFSNHPTIQLGRTVTPAHQSRYGSNVGLQCRPQRDIETSGASVATYRKWNIYWFVNEDSGGN